MNNSRRTAIKTTGAFATLVSLGIVTQSQAQAAVDRASFPGQDPGRCAQGHWWHPRHQRPGRRGVSRHR